jgi:hypothetical protein
MPQAIIHWLASCSRSAALAAATLVAAACGLAASAAEGPILFVTPVAERPLQATATHRPAPSHPVPFVTPSARPPKAASTRLGQALQAAEKDIRFVSPTPRAKVTTAELINPLNGAAIEPSEADESMEVIPAQTFGADEPAEPDEAEATDAAVEPDGAAPQTSGEPTPAESDSDDLDSLGLLQPGEAPDPIDDPAITGTPGTEAAPDRRPYRPITEIGVDTALPQGLAPGMPGSKVKGAKQETYSDIPEIGDPRLLGVWPGYDFQWSATAMHHRPLYFEDVNAERYGYTVSEVLQPAVSGAHFFASIAALPYKMTTHPPCECIYTLGHYRPGSCAPRRWHHEPVDPVAAGVQAGAVLGLIYIIP